MPCCAQWPDGQVQSATSSDRSITSGSDFLQLDVGDAPAGGRSDWLTAAAPAGDRRRPAADRQQAAGDPGARRRAARLPRRGHRGLPAADRGRSRRRAWPGRHDRRRRPGQAAPPPGVTARTAGRGRRSGRRRRARTSSTRCGRRRPGSTCPPGCPTWPPSRARPGCAPSGRCSASSPPPTSVTAIRAARRRCGCAVARWLARNRGIRVDPGEVIIVAGVAQALGLLAQVLRRRRDHRGSPSRTRARSAPASTCSTGSSTRRRSRSTTPASGSTSCAPAGRRR